MFMHAVLLLHWSNKRKCLPATSVTTSVRLANSPSRFTLLVTSPDKSDRSPFKVVLSPMFSTGLFKFGNKSSILVLPFALLYHTSEI